MSDHDDMIDLDQYLPEKCKNCVDPDTGEIRDPHSCAVAYAQVLVKAVLDRLENHNGDGFLDIMDAISRFADELHELQQKALEEGDHKLLNEWRYLEEAMHNEMKDIEPRVFAAISKIDGKEYVKSNGLPTELLAAILAPQSSGYMN